MAYDFVIWWSYDPVNGSSLIRTLSNSVGIYLIDVEVYRFLFYVNLWQVTTWPKTYAALWLVAPNQN